MLRMTLVSVLAGVLMAAGCGKDQKKDQADKGPAAVSPEGRKAARDARDQAALEAARRWSGEGEPKPVAQPGEEYKDNPDDPDAPKYTPMQKKFFRLRDLLTMSQIEEVMGGKAVESGEVYPGGATWAAWNEGSRRFLVQMLNKRLALWCSYDPKAPDSYYDKFQQVTVGMPKAEVRKRLGTSGKFMGSGKAGVNGGSNVYDHGENGYMIFFVDDKVAKILK